MRNVSLVRLSVSCFVLLFFVGASLLSLTATAQDGAVQERRAQERDSKTVRAQELKAKDEKAKRGKKIKPLICNDCDPGDGGGGGGGGGGYTGDGHIWCDGWDRQGQCAFNFPPVPIGVEFRRMKGNNGYDWQTYLTAFPIEYNDPTSRFPVPDGNVGLISPSNNPLPGQVPLHRWSTRKGFYYSIYNTDHGAEYIYGGIAGYVWPAGDIRGFPLYQFYSDEYGHFYTNFPRNEISCRPHVQWDFQGEMARVNWPGPASQALLFCGTLGPFPPSCDPFFVERCRQAGGFVNFQDCTCF